MSWTLTLQLQACRAQILDRWKISEAVCTRSRLGLARDSCSRFAFSTEPQPPLSGTANLSGIPPKSIAVLPFRNLSEDKENAFFADGIQDDLVTSLARIKDLKVPSLGSVASYRDLSGRRLRAIAEELGVGAVLEVAFVAPQIACWLMCS